VKVTDLTEPRLIRWREFPPRWVVPHATETGYLRFNTSYVGGPDGFVNIHPETGLVSTRTCIGLMWMPVGQRQFGLHRHTVCETYVILQGAVESIGPRVDADGTPGDRVETLDCMHMPVGAPHGSRTVGSEDMMMLWLHDALERDDAAIYYEDDDPALADLPAAQHIDWKSLEPSWDAPGASEPGTMQMLTSFVGGAEGYVNYNRGRAIESDRNALGLVDIPVGNAEAPHARACVRYCLVVSGEAAIVDRADLGLAGRWDMFVMPKDQSFSIRCVGVDPLRMVWILEEPEPLS
jgi:mannose-6-phosphate isomerase-like protein (cupin superfamily)